MDCQIAGAVAEPEAVDYRGLQYNSLEARADALATRVSRPLDEGMSRHSAYASHDRAERVLDRRDSPTLGRGR